MGHSCDTCHGHTGGGSPCYDGPEPQDITNTVLSCNWCDTDDQPLYLYGNDYICVKCFTEGDKRTCDGDGGRSHCSVAHSAETPLYEDGSKYRCFECLVSHNANDDGF